MDSLAKLKITEMSNKLDSMFEYVPISWAEPRRYTDNAPYSCAHCIYSEGDDFDGPFVCKRYPPKEGVGLKRSIYPEVDRDEVCGEGKWHSLEDGKLYSFCEYIEQCGEYFPELNEEYDVITEELYRLQGDEYCAQRTAEARQLRNEIKREKIPCQ